MDFLNEKRNKNISFLQQKRDFLHQKANDYRKNEKRLQIIYNCIGGISTLLLYINSILISDNYVKKRNSSLNMILILSIIAGVLNTIIGAFKINEKMSKLHSISVDCKNLEFRIIEFLGEINNEEGIIKFKKEVLNELRKLYEM